MIVARHIDKYYGDTQVLGGVNLHIGKGSIYGLAGRSGAGKSTLLRCINGLEPYDSGSLIVDGIDIKTLRDRDMRAFRKKVGMIFQNFSLLERLTVYDNVALPMKCWKYRLPDIDRKVLELLGLVGLAQKSGHKPRALSGGQKQRVAIARALTLDPQILLCDEATSALDPKTAEEILSLLCRINRQFGITIVMVTHQMSVLRRACSEVAILENGRLDSRGSVEQIFRQQPRALRNLLGDQAEPDPPEPGKLTLRVSGAGDLAGSMAAALGIDLTIVGTQADADHRNGSGLTLRIFDHDYQNVAGYLDERQAIWRTVDHETSQSPSVN